MWIFINFSSSDSSYYLSEMADNHAPFLESALARGKQLERCKELFEAAVSSKPLLTINDGSVLRRLKNNEIRTLQRDGHCRCADWTKLRLWLPNERESKRDHCNKLRELVSFTTFEGIVVIGLPQTPTSNKASETTTAATHDGKLAAGIHHNSLISNCILEASCSVYRNSILSSTYVGKDTEVVACGRITCAKNVTLGSIKITVGAESGGGRELDLAVENTMMDVCEMLEYKQIEEQEESTTSTTTDWNLLGEGCVVRDTPTIRTVCLASNSRIEGATSVENAVLLPTARVTNGASVSNVLLQWEASVSNHSTVTDALLMEHAHAGPQSVVAESVLGPDVHVSAGEIHASVMGPNTNAHHQSLVIGVLWPLGRGNVGYGANVGSNHTGRIPDQETTAGEGIFWGLSTVIKFPIDLSYAPYSIVAAGTVMVPQRITMPFSLLVEQQGETQIIPGWVLHYSPFTITRSEAKYAKRRKAVRHKHYTGWKIIRPDIVDMCWAARAALDQAGSVDGDRSNQHIDGIGQATLSEKGRTTGMLAYTQCIQRYALQGLLEWMQATQPESSIASAIQQELENAQPIVPLVLDKVAWPPLPWAQDGSIWDHQKSLLASEFPLAGTDPTEWICQQLQLLVSLEKQYATRVVTCKQRDDKRGVAIVPGYSDSHVAAEDDSVVVSVRQHADALEQTVAAMIQRLTETN